ncbi:MAG: hypothetical protein JW941_05450 [Candidatus Coatesbacteria bacterium]|nr:hypothetical protein [Candidatus Coatesbacteria bacterium]
MSCIEGDDEHLEQGRDLMAKWRALLSVVERRFKAAVAKEEKNGRLKPETEKTVTTYIRTLQAFAKEVKQIEASGKADGAVAREVAKDLWGLSLSRRDKSAIATVLRELNLPAEKNSSGKRGESHGRIEGGSNRGKSGTDQRELALDDTRDEDESCESAVGPS